jgi:hypothetical protein
VIIYSITIDKLSFQRAKARRRPEEGREYYYYLNQIKIESSQRFINYGSFDDNFIELKH